jgi:hypothetical protein
VLQERPAFVSFVNDTVSSEFEEGVGTGSNFKDSDCWKAEPITMSRDNNNADLFQEEQIDLPSEEELTGDILVVVDSFDLLPGFNAESLFKKVLFRF